MLLVLVPGFEKSCPPVLGAGKPHAAPVGRRSQIPREAGICRSLGGQGFSLEESHSSQTARSVRDGEVRTEGDEETGLCQMERALLFRAFGFDGVSSRELVGFFSSRVMCLNCHWLVVLAALCTMGWRSERKDRK